ncbi:hypothetical protein [Sphingomonas sp. VDB2]|uniref:hypothetical protein n=1 Tax=Sphingomonas sp. VDB2 TaxID=3228751 RepID=UPI003A80F66B
MSFVTLNECPPGIFRTEEGSYGFKSEYSSKGKCDAYCLDSGEYFYGGEMDAEGRGLQMVEPADVVADLTATKAELQKVRQIADERLAALDRANAQITELKADLRRAQSDAADRERDARHAREATDLARQAAAELRGRLKEVRANQMVRRGDLVGFGEARVPNFDPYDDGVPF